MEIGIDPAQFTKGQRDAMDALRKFEEEATEQGKRVEGQTRRLNEVLQNFKRETLGALGIFVGGYGLKELITNITNLDAATGRFAYTTNQSTQEVSAWQAVFKQVGGSAENANASLGALTEDMQKFAATGQSASLGALNSLQIGFYKANGQMKTAREVWLEVADAIKGLDPAQAATRIRMIAGANDDLINVLVKGRPGVEKMYDAAIRAGTASAESAGKAQEFQKELGLLGTAATNAGRAIMDVLYPALTAITTKFRELVELSPGASGVVGILGGLVGLKVGGSILKGGIRRVLGGGAAAGAARAAGGWALGGSSAATGAAVVAGGTVAGATLAIAGGALLSMTSRAGESDAAEAARRDPAAEEAYRRAHPELLGGGGTGTLSANASPAEIEAYIRRAATARHIDPDVAIQVYRSEGKAGYVGDRGSSFGPFQLHYGGVAGGGMAVGGLGDTFTKKTGLDARDRSTQSAQIDFALDQAKKGGWGPWHGWKGDAFAGLGGQAAAMGRAGGGSGGGASTSTTTVTIGKIDVNAPNATDAGGIAKEIGPAIDRQVQAGAANYGLQ